MSTNSTIPAHRESRPRRWLTGTSVALAAALTAAPAGPAAAADGLALAVYTGVRDGGSFRDSVTGKSTSIQSSEVFAASLDVPLDPLSQLQVFYSFQDSRLGSNSFTAGMPVSRVIPLQVMYLQVGGRNFFSGVLGHGGYVVGALGATRFDATSAGYDSDLRLSANVALGYEQPLGKRVSLRFEARGYFTLVNSSGGVICSGGCLISLSGSGIVQGELSVGLAVGL